MSDIRIAIQHFSYPEKAVYESLIEFYETMKQLETDPHKGGKQATKIVMTANDLMQMFREFKM